MLPTEILDLIIGYKNWLPDMWDEAMVQAIPHYDELSVATRTQREFDWGIPQFVANLYAQDFMPKEDYDRIRAAIKAEPLKLVPGPKLSYHERLLVKGAEYLKVAFSEAIKATWPMVVKGGRAIEDAVRFMIRELWDWLRENVPLFLDWLWGHTKAAFEKYWPPVEAAIEAAGEHIFDWTTKYLLGQGEVTPEKAPGMAAKMLTLALTAGITAHAMSVGFEMIHPFKSLGFHQMTGMVAQLGSFGPVSAATLGQIHYAALRRPMSYAVNKVTRSQLPDESILQIMAVKPDIPMEQFVETMKYHGYNDYWIDRIKRTMFHEPRYFELKMMSEDIAATDEWLHEKVRRAGYNEVDTAVFVKSLRASAIKMQRLDYYKQGANLFKEGYIPREYFEKILDDIELLPKAKKFSVRAAELAYLMDVTKDEIKYWTDSYLKDLVTEEELTLQLTLLGVNPLRRDLVVRLARVRKYKKPGRPVKTELEKVTDKVRTKYSQAYIALYRKELIDLDTLLADLVAIGILPELAEATCVLEAARKATPAEA